VRKIQAFLSKPCDIEELKKILERVLKGGQ
jgi:YesN/AraC family two-component response regulator